MMGELDASGINDAKTGVFLPLHQLADHQMEHIHQFLKHVFLFLLVEVVEDSIVGWEVLRKNMPLAACFKYNT